MQHARMLGASSNEGAVKNRSAASKGTASPRSQRHMSSNQASLTVGSNRVFSNHNHGQHRHRNHHHHDHDSDSDIYKNSRTLVAGRTSHSSNRLDRSDSSRSDAASKKDLSNNHYIEETKPVQVTLWFHELRTTKEDILIDPNSLPNGISPGQVIEIQSLDSSNANNNKKLIFKLGPKNIQNQNDNADSSSTETRLKSSVHSQSQSQVSLMSHPFQNLLDLAPRSVIQIRKITDLDSVAIDSMEVFIKDVNLSRDAMWQFASTLVGTCCYSEQRLTYLGFRIGVVKYIYKHGRRVFSGYVNEETKVIFRSESAKLTVLVQLSREMWNFEENGEIMFHKLVNNLFPKIFRRWRNKGTHHSITIVLFTSVDLTDIPWTNLAPGERPPTRKDFYRVVVDQVNILHWDRIMANLRLEFANFKRDILLRPGKEDSSYVMEGQTLPAVKGNLLEAVNVGLVLLNDRFRNTDLKHSLGHFMVITAGTGLYDVDYKMLLDTSQKITSIDTSLDIICLNQPPLHVTPLFRFIRDGKLSHCVPIWCDISFYRDNQEENSIWIPRCKIYELQMMGVMENDSSFAWIPRYHLDKQTQHLPRVMDRYDENVFKPIRRKSEKIAESTTEEPKFKAPSVKNSKATLSLIFNERTSLIPVDSSTTNSSAVGTVTHPVTNTSALTKLYNINKNSDRKPKSPTSSIYSDASPPSIQQQQQQQQPPQHPLQHLQPSSRSTSSPRMSSPRIPPPTSSSSSTTTSSASKLNIETFRKDAGSPRIIQGKTLFSRRETAQSQSSHSPEEAMSPQGDKVVSVPTPETECDDPYCAYWTEIKNPSQQVPGDILQAAPLSRWSNLFPDNIQRKLIKWRSFQAPAALPIVTRVFPTQKQLHENYTFQLYSVYLNPDNYLELDTTSDLMREMIQLRLMLGFQICYGDKVKKAEAERNSDGLIKYFPLGSCLGSLICMSIGDEIHRIHCDFNGNLNVQLYRKKNKVQEENKIMLGQRPQAPYYPLIRTRYADEFVPAQVDALVSHPQTYNWNQFDQMLAGFDDSMPEDRKEFHKMKFVVMPADIPQNAYFLSNEQLTAEEIRVEGLRKLIGVIEKGKYSKAKSNLKNNSPRVSDIIFYTGNLFDFLNDEAENYDITGNQPTLMIPEHMRFNKTIKLPELASEMQNPRTGLNLVDRNWHFKKHLQCFIGSELVTWLVESFEDIDTRDEAVSYGQSLINKGLFKHVESRHGFIDGYYFYEIEPQYFEKMEKIKRGSWFGNTAKREGSTTPKSNASPRIQGQDDLIKITSSSNLTSESSSVTDSTTHRKRKKFNLSKSVKFNVDPLGRSYRPELMTVHYDKVHNPEHCYHIRLQWLNTTNKFIEDTITAWSRLCERYGLKLVETPWKELCSIPKVSPFHSFVEVKLSINPWHDEEFADDQILSANRYYYHLFFLKKLDFLLDNRASSFFSRDNIEITYSWGKPMFQYAQFIHRTGFYIIELRDNGDFFLAPNNMHLIRVGASSSPSSGDYGSNARAIHLDSQRIMMNFRAACQNVDYLRGVFREAKSSWSEETITQI
ncbi:uncharacterized protein LODBEIA_P28160 [Lodderomyces beijingensis]|uniref:Vacuolar membrane-associated protein IML1 n=1 Tax=Lodderomyces beijingensis TaxID=1775926 RepID=A0ABP0ZKB7_9ASCO